MSYRSLTEDDQMDMHHLLFLDSPEPDDEDEFPEGCGQPRDLTEDDIASYPERILIEHSCQNCGCGFSSIKPSPKFCCAACRCHNMRHGASDGVKKLWGNPEFLEKIRSARAAAGYPDTNRPAAIARRKMRAAVTNNLRRSLRRMGAVKDARTKDLVGYSTNDLVRHIESLFLHGMDWGNYGEWEIDHIFPVARFPLGTPMRVINALTNLRPLWKADNMRKWAHVGV